MRPFRAFRDRRRRRREAFIAAVPGDARREDAQKLSTLVTVWTGEPPVMWGSSIVGFGCYRYRHVSGREGTAALVGFSPRSANLVLYLVGGVQTDMQSCCSGLVPQGTKGVPIPQAPRRREP